MKLTSILVIVLMLSVVLLSACSTTQGTTPSDEIKGSTDTPKVTPDSVVDEQITADLIDVNDSVDIGDLI